MKYLTKIYRRNFNQAASKVVITSDGKIIKNVYSGECEPIGYFTYHESKEVAGDYATRHFGKMFLVTINDHYTSRHKKFYREDSPVWTAHGEHDACVSLWSAALLTALEDKSLEDCSIICDVIGVDPDIFRQKQLEAL